MKSPGKGDSYKMCVSISLTPKLYINEGMKGINKSLMVAGATRLSLIWITNTFLYDITYPVHINDFHAKTVIRR